MELARRATQSSIEWMANDYHAVFLRRRCFHHDAGTDARRPSAYRQFFLTDDLVENVTMNIGKSVVASTEAEGQPFMINP